MGIFTKLLEMMKLLIQNYLTKKEIKLMSLDKLKRTEIIGEAGAGLVKVIYSRNGEPLRVEIDDLIFKETDKQLVSDLFVAATKQAIEKFAKIAIETYAAQQKQHRALFGK